MDQKIDQLTQALIKIPKFGNGIGLHRMQYLCQKILASEWFAQSNPIHVVGSNGKGSVTVILSALLRALGIRTGQYTSPHLFDFSERIVVDGQAIANSALENYYQHFLDKEAAYKLNAPEDHFGAFEAFTFIALTHFQAQACEAMVLEAGIGGRYDSTRVAQGSHVAFTSIDLEHSKLLGHSLELIAFDKLDIAKEGATVVLGEITDKALLQRIKNYAQLKNIKLLCVAEHCQIKNIVIHAEEMHLSFSMDGLEFNHLCSKLIGKHQASNIMVAILLLKNWLNIYYPAITAEQFVHAVQNTLPRIQWPGRFQKISTAPNIFIDVGHSPAAIYAIIDLIKKADSGDWLVVLGISPDKDIATMARPFLELASSIFCTQSYHRAGSSADIFNILQAHNERKIEISNIPKLESAIDMAILQAKRMNKSILIVGGLFLAIEAYAYLQGRSPESLHFF